MLFEQLEISADALKLYGQPINLTGRSISDVCYDTIQHDTIAVYITGAIGTTINIFALFVNLKSKTGGMRSFYPTITFVQVANTFTFFIFCSAFIPLIKSFGILCCGFVPIYLHIKPFTSWCFVASLQGCVMAGFMNLMFRSHQIILLPSSRIRINPEYLNIVSGCIPICCIAWMLTAIFASYPTEAEDIFQLANATKKLFYAAILTLQIPSLVLFIHTIIVINRDKMISQRTRKMHFEFVKTCLLMCAQMFFFSLTPHYTNIVSWTVGLNKVWSVFEKIIYHLHMVATNICLLYFIRPFRQYIVKHVLRIKKTDSGITTRSVVPADKLFLYGQPINLTNRSIDDVCFNSIQHDVLGMYIFGGIGTVINIFALFVNFKAKTGGMKAFYPTITFVQITNSFTFFVFYICFIPLIKSFGLLCCGFVPLYFKIEPYTSFCFVFGLRGLVVSSFLNLMFRSHQLILLPSSKIRIDTKHLNILAFCFPVACVAWMMIAMWLSYPTKTSHAIFRLTAFSKRLLHIAQIGVEIPSFILFIHTLFVVKKDKLLSQRTKKMHYEFVKTCLILCAQMFFSDATPYYTTIVTLTIGLNRVWSVIEKISFNLFTVVTNILLMYYIIPFRRYIQDDILKIKRAPANVGPQSSHSTF